MLTVSASSSQRSDVVRKRSDDRDGEHPADEDPDQERVRIARRLRQLGAGG